MRNGGTWRSAFLRRANHCGAGETVFFKASPHGTDGQALSGTPGQRDIPKRNVPLSRPEDGFRCPASTDSSVQVLGPGHFAISRVAPFVPHPDKFAPKLDQLEFFEIEG